MQFLTVTVALSALSSLATVAVAQLGSAPPNCCTAGSAWSNGDATDLATALLNLELSSERYDVSANSCLMTQCVGDTGIWICNDDGKDLILNGLSASGAAQVLRESCDNTCGQYFTDGGWNAIVHGGCAA